MNKIVFKRETSKLVPPRITWVSLDYGLVSLDISNGRQMGFISYF